MCRTLPVSVVLVNVVWFLASSTAFGQCAEHDYVWVGESGDWWSPENWEHEEPNPDPPPECVGAPGVPGSGEWAWIANGGTATITGAATVQHLELESSGATLLGGSFASPEALRVNWGGWFSQMDGTVNVLALDLGGFFGSSASYHLQGGQLHTTGVDHIGFDGHGVFTQSGGTYTAGDHLVLGRFPDSNGAYDMSNGLLLSESMFTVGFDGDGMFTQTGGVVRVTGMGEEEGLFAVGLHSQASGTYRLTGGTLSTREATLGHEGTGTFVHNGGTNTVADTLTLGAESTAHGTYELSENGELSARFETVGVQGAGTFVQTGGTNGIMGHLMVGGAPGGSGTYELSGSGELSAKFETVGDLGAGTFVQAGGTNTIIAHLMVGGAYELSGSGELWAGAESIGGTFMHTGGSNTIVQQLNIGGPPENNGVYEFSGEGELFTAFETVGGQGSGTFLHSAGTHTVVRDLVLGEQPGSTGTYQLHPQAELFAETVIVGRGGTGTFTQTGGSNPIIGRLALGESDTGVGTYNLEQNGWLFAWTGEIGVEGNGVFLQNEGQSVFPSLVLGDLSGSYGRLELNGGLLAVGQEAIGSLGEGEIVHTGGVHVVSTLLMGTHPGSFGSYHLAEGADLTVGDLTFGVGELVVAHEGEAEFTQTGGTCFVASEIFNLGNQAGASGTYTLAGGELTHRGPNRAILVGLDGSGTFNVGGGGASPYLDATWIAVGTAPGAGTFDITDPKAEIVVGWLTLGHSATFQASPGARVHVTNNNVSLQQGGRGFVDNQSTDEAALSGLENLNLICDGQFVVLEVAGYDGGPFAHCADNFVIDTLTVNGLSVLVDDFDNGNRGGNAGWSEALYVNDLVFGPNGMLFTNGINVYVDCEIADNPQICTGSERGDLDRNCDVDLGDYSSLAECITGPDQVPSGSFAPHCAVFDFDFDYDLDLADIAQFQLAFTGSR